MMTGLERENHAKRLITENCLIAADVDRTILVQIEDRGKEQQEFFRHLANDLVETVRLGSRKVISDVPSWNRQTLK